MGVVYRITHKASGTTYVGSSVDVKKRWRNHKSQLRRGEHRNPHLQSAWNRYGKDAFTFSVLEQVADEADLLEREQYYLDRAFEVGDTYNIAREAAAPMLEVNFSEEHKRKLSEAAMGNRRCRGYKHTDETRRKMSAAMKGNQHCVGRVAWNKGKKGISEETRRKMSENHAGPYPAFKQRETGEVIPGGMNLRALCRERGLHYGCMRGVKDGKRKNHKGWILAHA